MEEYREFTGKTVDEAITDACSSLLVTSDELDYVVIRQPVSGFLGIGSKDALIRARKKQSDYEEIPEEERDERPVREKKKFSAPKERAEEKEAEKEPEVELVPMSETDISADAGVEFLKDILREMEIEADVKTAFNPVDDTVSFEIVGTGMGLLIGKRGKTLDALQYLLSLVMNKGSERYIRVKLDTEDYRRRRKETLETLARNMASKARKTRRNVELEPMNAYERRIIHYSLQNNRYVTTHSEGEDPYRHVVIVPNQATGSSRHYN